MRLEQIDQLRDLDHQALVGLAGDLDCLPDPRAGMNTSDRVRLAIIDAVLDRERDKLLHGGEERAEEAAAALERWAQPLVRHDGPETLQGGLVGQEPY